MSLYQYDFHSNFFQPPSERGASPRMHYLDEGEGDPIVLLHGNPTWSYYYRRIIPILAASHRVVVPDHIGCGLSDKPLDYPYVLDQHIQNLTSLLDSLKLKKVSLLVHDWGGAIGLGFATRFPERICRISLLNTCAFHLPHTPWFLKLAHIPLLGEFLVRQLNLFLLIALRVGSRTGATNVSPIRDGYLFPYSSYNDRTAIYRFVLDIPLHPMHPSFRTLTTLEQNLSCLSDIPLLVLWGMKDPVFTPEVLDVWLSKFPNAEVERFNNGGHFILEDELPRVAERLESFFATGSVAP